MDTNSLEDIIYGCKKGRRESQEMLFKMFSGKMYAVSLYYSNNKEEAEDILHNGFIKVFQKIGQFKGTGVFEAWMRRIFMNTALEHFRKKSILYPINEELAYENSAMEADIISDMASDELVKLIQELSPGYRLIFNLYAIEGYTHKEIAEMLGIAEGTSKSNLSRARIILQNKVKQQFNLSGRKIK